MTTFDDARRAAIVGDFLLRALGAPTIEASVKEFVTPVPLDPEASVEEVLAQRGYAEFLELTGLAPEHPDDFRVSSPHGYERLLDHVHVHRHYLGIEGARAIPWADAVRSWVESVYRPMAATIRAHGPLEAFPPATEADLYLAAMDHLHHLRERHGRDVSAERAAQEVGTTLRRRRSWGERVRGWLRRP